MSTTSKCAKMWYSGKGSGLLEGKGRGVWGTWERLVFFFTRSVSINSRSILCMCVCMYACVCVCLCGVVVVSRAQGPRSWVQAQLRQFFHLIFPSASHQPHQSTQLWLGTWHLLGCEFKAFSHETAMVQVGLWVPTPLVVRKGLFSCKFLARLQELCLHGSQCLLSTQAFWLCQVRVTA